MLRSLLNTAVLFLLLIFTVPSVSAAFLYFSPPTKSASKGEIIQIDMLLDTEGEQVSAADAYIEYDNTVLSVQSVQNKSVFPYQTHAITDTRIAIRGLTFDAQASVSGIGTMATVIFQVLTEGQHTLTFSCSLADVSTSRIVKNDATGTNIINCTKNGSVALTIGGPTATSTPSPTPSLPITTCSLKNKGDADCNNLTNLTDFEIWRKEFTGELSSTKADFNGSGSVTIADFEAWRKNFFP